MDFNKVFLIGNVTRSPERVTLPSGDRVARFTVATGSRWRDSKTNDVRENTEFHDVVAWGNRAELIQRLELRKGTRIHVEGALHHGEWQDKSGQRRSRTEVTLSHLIVLNAREEHVPGEVAEVAERLAHDGEDQTAYPQGEPRQPSSAE
jgi:single-strand DNA-binding protein